MSDERQVGSQFRLRFVSPRVVTLASIALLIIFTISAPEDYKASRHGTESILPPQMIVERVSGEAPPDYFVGPSWCLDKPAVHAAIEQELERRQTWQGRQFPS